MREKRGPLVALIALLAFLGWRIMPATSPNGEERAGSTAAAKVENGEEPDGAAAGSNGFARALEAFIRSGVMPPAKGEEKGEDAPTAIGDVDWQIPDWDIDFLIALVPDPIDATIGYRFDSAIDAIRQGAEASGYVFDRYYYPWLTSKGAKVGAPGPSDVVEHVLRTKPPRIVSEPRPADRYRAYEEQPGMLVFRSGFDRFRELKNDVGSGKRLLVVLLVGENAVSGVHKRALAQALTFTRNYQTWSNEPFLVMGPFFSGTQSSLSHALSEWSVVTRRKRKDDAYSFHLISGSATAVDPEKFELALSAAGQQAIKHIRFRGTLIPEEIILRALLANLEMTGQGSTGKSASQIALLRESNTGFGDALWSGVSGSMRAHTLVSFPFPLHISGVRVGYNKSGDTGQTALPSLPTFGGKLRIPLEEADTARDLYPPVHPTMTATAAERQLTSALASINHERFRYAVIASSDIRDRIFLAKLLREQCPDVQLLLTNSDLLHSHPDYLPYLRGAMVGSTYPLFGKTQRWSPGFDGNRQRQFFPSEAEQGGYNATVALLAELAELRKLPTQGRLIDYGTPFVVDPPVGGWRPPIWISMIGQSGPQPLMVVDERMLGTDHPAYTRYVYAWKIGRRQPGDHDRDKQLAGAQITGEPVYTPQYTGFWITPYVALCGFLLWVAWACTRPVAGLLLGALAWLLERKFVTQWLPAKLAARLKPAQWAPAWLTAPSDQDSVHLVNLLSPRSPGPLRWHQLLFALVCVLVAIGIGLGLAVVAYRPITAGGAGLPVEMRWWQTLAAIAPTILTIVLLVFGLIYLIYLGVMALERATPPPAATAAPPKFSLLRRCWLPLVLAALLALTAARFDLTPTPEPTHRWWGTREGWLFFYERATNLSSGISPLLPPAFLAVGSFWWAYARLKRLFFLDRFHVEVPFPEEGMPRTVGTEEFHELKERHASTLDVLQRPQANVWTRASWLAWFVLAYAFSRLTTRFGATAEGAMFDYVLLLSLMAFSVLLVFGLLELVQIWKAVAQVLKEIARLPMRQAFNRLPRRLTANFGPYLFSHRPLRTENMLDRRRQQELVLKKFDFLAKEPGFPRDVLAKLEEERRAFAAADAPTAPPDAKGQSLKSTAWDCLAALQFFWKDLSVGEALEDVPPSGHAGDAEKDGANTGGKHKDRTTAHAASAGVVVDAVVHVHRPDDGDAAERWRALAEDFVALEVLTYLSQFFIQLRNTLTFLTAGSILLLLAVISYPLQPQRLWLFFAGAIVVAVMTVAIRLFIQIERDDVVSRVSGTTPNQIDWLHGSLVTNLLTYALPLIGILAAASTDMSDLLHSWLDPLLHSVR